MWPVYWDKYWAATSSNMKEPNMKMKWTDEQCHICRNIYTYKTEVGRHKKDECECDQYSERSGNYKSIKKPNMNWNRVKVYCVTYVKINMCTHMI